MFTLSTTDEAPRPLKLRDGDDRRTQPDRRRSSVDMRLRVGLWYQYHRATRAGEFDQLQRNPYTRGKLQEALLPEMQKYVFSQPADNSCVSPCAALSAAVDFVWSHNELGCNAAGEPTSVYTINAISEHLVRSFKVEVVDRRKSNRRSASAASS